MIEIRKTHSNGVVYLLDGDWHRPNGPAKVWSNGDWGWWLNGQRHRYYGSQAWHGSWYTHGNRTR